MIKLPLLILCTLIANSAYAEQSLATIANNLTSGASIISNLMISGCIVVGITLIALAGVHYKAHRHSPKMIPLTKPILYIVLGLILFAIPFLEDYVAKTGRSVAFPSIHKQTSQNTYTYTDIDAPLNNTHVTKK